MGAAMYLDAAALGVPALLGLLGAWLGAGRFLVLRPIRWLAAGLGASIAALLVALYLVINRDALGLLYLSGAAATFIISAVAFLIVLPLLLMFMGNFKERVKVWTGERRIGLVQRAFGGLFGILCGLVLTAVPYLLYDALRPDPGDDPPWLSESRYLPYVKDAAGAAKNAVSPFLPSAGGQQRRQR
jgi:Colicin V production protein